MSLDRMDLGLAYIEAKFHYPPVRPIEAQRDWPKDLAMCIAAVETHMAELYSLTARMQNIEKWRQSSMSIFMSHYTPPVDKKTQVTCFESRVDELLSRLEALRDYMEIHLGVFMMSEGLGLWIKLRDWGFPTKIWNHM